MFSKQLLQQNYRHSTHKKKRRSPRSLLQRKQGNAIFTINPWPSKNFPANHEQQSHIFLRSRTRKRKQNKIRTIEQAKQNGTQMTVKENFTVTGRSRSRGWREAMMNMTLSSSRHKGGENNSNQDDNDEAIAHSFIDLHLSLSLSLVDLLLFVLINK